LALDEEIESVQDIANLRSVRVSDVVETLAALGLVDISENLALMLQAVRDFVRAGNFQRMRIPFDCELLRWDKGEIIDDTSD
jgi:hypothetical protein